MNNHPSPTKPVLFVIFFTFSAALSACADFAIAAEPPGYINEIRDLREISTSVIIGSVERREVGVTQTTAAIRVVKSFAGDLKEGGSIKLVTRVGRVQVDKNEPDLTGVDRAVFYLTRDSNGAYRCANDNYGFKPIIHDNVYTNPQNPLETVKLKKYQESLIAVLQPKVS